MMILQKNRSVNNYFEIHGIDKDDNLQIEMLKNNDFRYIADCRFREIDNEVVMLCKLDGMSTLLSVIQRGSVQVSEIMLFLFSLSECLKEMQEYILSSSSMILDPTYILYDPGKGHYRFIIAPGAGKDFAEQFKGIMEELLAVMDHSDRSSVMFIYEFFSGNVLRDNFTAEAFIMTMDRTLSGGAVSTGRWNDYSDSSSEEVCGQYSQVVGSGVIIDSRKQRLPMIDTAVVGRNIQSNEYDIGSGNYMHSSTQEISTDELNHQTIGRGTGTGKNKNDAGRIKNLGLYCLGGVITAVGVILSIAYGLQVAKIMVVVALIYIAVLANRILKTREEERLEEDMRLYGEAGDRTKSADRIKTTESERIEGRIKSVDETKPAVRNIYTSVARDEGTDSNHVENDIGETALIKDTAFTVQQIMENPVTRLVPVDINLLRADNQIFLLGDRLTVGRASAEADYCLAVPGISRVHAELIKNGNSYMVNDLNSTNGTYVNSVRIMEPTRLCYGDVLSFATVDFYCM